MARRNTARRAPVVRGPAKAQANARRAYETRVLEEAAQRRKAKARKTALKRAKGI